MPSTICISDLGAQPAHADISHANLRGGVSLSVLVERQSPWATFILFLHNSEAETVRSIEEITASEARNAAA